MKLKNANCSRRLRNLTGWRRPLSKIWLVAAIGLLFPALAQAAFKSELQGRNAGSTNWSGGPLGGWLELDYVPMRSLHTGGPVSNQVITVSFDHSKSTIPGMEDLAGFTASSNVVITAGPTLSSPPGVDIWSYSYTITVTDDQPGTVEFYGRLAAGSHLFAGSSLSLSLGGILQISKPAAQAGNPDLAIAKAGPTEAKTNQVITYAISYTNKWSSPDTAVGVQVSDILPPEVSYVPGSASKGARIVGNTITWDVGNLKPGSRGLLTYKVMVTNNLPVTTTFANYAQILSSHDDPTPADNVSSVTTTVVITPNPLAVDDFYSIVKNGVLTVPAPGVLLNDSNAASGVLFSGPVNGTVAFNTNGSFIYTPDTNFVGTDIFAYRALNVTNMLSGPAVVTIEVTNAAPVPTNQAVTLPEDTATNLVLTATDAEGDPLTFAIVTGPTNGSLSGFNLATGDVTYTPNTNFNGTDSFTFQVSDGLTNSGIATVNLTVTPVNDTPVAMGQAVTLLEDTATNLVLTASDLEGDPLTYVIASGPSNGSLSGFNPFTGAVTYTPDPEFTGGDNFTFRASDGVNNSAVAAVTINVLPVNDDPVAVADVASTTKNTPVNLDVLDNDYDVDGDTLTITVATATNGSVTIIGGTNLFFVPVSNFVGYATVAYSIEDGQGGFASAPGVVNIAVGTNAPPVAVNDHLTTPEDTEILFDPRSNDYDLDADPVIIISVWPTNGTVTLAGGTNLIFVPNTNFTGLATIGYSIADTNGAIGSAVIGITVTPVNDPPVVLDDLVTMNEDSTNTISVLANDSDPDGDWLTVVSVTNTNGTATVVSTNVIYTPSPDYFGTNVLTYCATDGAVTNCASVTVVVLPVNDAPVALDQNVIIPEDTATNLVLTATDVDSSGLVFALLTGPVNGSLGTLESNTGAVTYTPNANYHGPDSLTFSVFDGSLHATGTVAIVVIPIQDAPIAVDDFITTPEDTAVSIPVLANDSDPDDDPLTFVSVITTNGTAVAVGTNVVYTPSLDFNGTNVMTYAITDGQGGTNSAFVTVAIAPPSNDAPVADDQTVTISEDTSTNLVLTATDVDSTGLVYAILGGPAHGGLNGLDTNSGAVTYLPGANYNGPDSFTFTVYDGSLYATGTVTVTVTPINDPPVANDISLTTPEETEVLFTLTGTDADGNTLTFGWLPEDKHGYAALNANTGEAGYTPATDYTGTNHFHFTVFDGSLYATGGVTITVLPANDSPVAADDSYSTPANGALTVAASGVLTNDTDADGDSLTAVLVSSPLHGTLSLSANGGFIYTPTNNYSGPDSFTYCANDSTTNSDPATVSINVTPLADMALFMFGPTNATPGQNLNFTITITNLGPSTASNVLVFNVLPTNLVFVSASAGGALSNNLVIWPVLPSLAKDATTNLTLTLTAPTNGSLVNYAYVIAVTPDPDLSNNDGSASFSRITTFVVQPGFDVRQGMNVFNPQTGLYEQLVSVTNLSGATAAAFQVLVGDFASTNGTVRTNVWLWNATGTSLDGRRYVQYNSPLDPGSNATVRLEFYNPTRVPFTNSIEILVTIPAAAVTNLTGGVTIDRAFTDTRIAGDTRFVIEWTSIVGTNYTIIYGPTVNGPWTAATPTVTATGTRTQWYDDGPPKTGSKPLSSSSRFYRVILNQ